jgi:4-hydroxy-tetrahydrodipicolinate synthase
MRADGSVDEQSLRGLVEFHVANGTDVIVAVGTTGEASTLSTEEHTQVIRRVVQFSAGRVPVVAGTGSNSTREAIELTQAAQEAGADACLLVTPYYVKPTQEGLFQHFKAVAEAVAIPQILYNVPGRTAVDMQNATVERLSHVSNIVGIKDATGNLERGKELIQMCGDRIDIYSGDDATAMELILMGAKGDISVTANVAPKAMHEMCAAARAGDRATAAVLNDKLMGLHKNLFVEANPIPVKWAVQQLGLIPEGIRLPLTPLSAQHHETVRQAMRQAGVL